MHEDDKRRAAEAAVAEIREGMLVGLGTGSTAAFAIAALAARVRDGLRIEAVATSAASASLARAGGIAVRDFAGVARLDLAIDGVDEIDADCRAIKGAGGAMLREKIVAAAADRMVAIADGSKRVARLGTAALPVEVLPFARAAVLARLGSGAAVRQADAGDYRTDNGNIVVDARLAALPGDGDVMATARWLAAIPGVLGHGLFLDEIDAAYVAGDGVVTRLERGDASG